MNYTDLGQNGLQSELFERTTSGKTEYAYAYAGTNSLEDVAEDVAQLFGAAPQYYIAIDNAKTLSKELKNNELTFVGHSLGGGEAAAASMATGRAAITFNPAAVSCLTSLFNGLGKASKVINYRTVGYTIKSLGLKIGGDPVNNFQENMGLRIPGRIINVPIGIKNPYSSHSIYQFLNRTLPNVK